MLVTLFLFQRTRVHMTSSKAYRPGVGMIIVNNDNFIFLGQRRDKTNSWQMPQGGINPNENPDQAMRRELKEEIGTSHVRIISSKENYIYDLPLSVTSKLWDGKYTGQRQTWYALRFLGKNKEINIFTKYPEFQNWRWATKDEVIDCAYTFKKSLYESIFQDLWPKVLEDSK